MEMQDVEAKGTQFIEKRIIRIICNKNKICSYGMALLR